ncbi:hypothetical protein L249_6445 [Ophiocordyceps polyrhachis-furcata BCC 54312]|uniref:Uncharacterized protein n=1 Tax=Ophiocordyceps polyrhachis-furcata BCC 54312 TaxID=1330021 RepID=A0A367LL81_9HYPO|nr:hypothetical protein L249_6445 [Ophiocordyceps polyrhachis-furcata BCC 54312]
MISMLHIRLEWNKKNMAKIMHTQRFDDANSCANLAWIQDRRLYRQLWITPSTSLEIPSAYSSFCTHTFLNQSYRTAAQVYIQPLLVTTLSVQLRTSPSYHDLFHGSTLLQRDVFARLVELKTVVN